MHDLRQREMRGISKMTDKVDIDLRWSLIIVGKT